MTDQELKRITQFKITSVNSFDDPNVNWPGDEEWGEELLEVTQDLEALELRRQEDEERAAEQKQQEMERAAEEKRWEKERERVRKGQEKEQERKRKAQERERERERKAQEKQNKKPSTKRQKTTHQAGTDGSFFHLMPPCVSSQPVASTSTATTTHSAPTPASRNLPHTPAFAQGGAMQRALVGTNDWRRPGLSHVKCLPTHLLCRVELVRLI
ncbi:hypothetical protein FRC06_008144 [Ceratobasidium sp. 370]|nr:hypothetical protein FRC06_008144 [Ceratobasidium sp. 370]